MAADPQPVTPARPRHPNALLIRWDVLAWWVACCAIGFRLDGWDGLVIAFLAFMVGLTR
jgi:hypothetical protein